MTFLLLISCRRRLLDVHFEKRGLAVGVETDILDGGGNKHRLATLDFHGFLTALALNAAAAGGTHIYNKRVNLRKILLHRRVALEDISGEILAVNHIDGRIDLRHIIGAVVVIQFVIDGIHGKLCMKLARIAIAIASVES